MHMPASLSENTLALLRRYMASHALFNGLSALQLSLLSNEARQGLDLLRHHAAYLRALSAVSDCPVCCNQADEWRLLESWTWLENQRHNGKEPIRLSGKLSGGRMPSWLLLPFLEFQELRNPADGKLDVQLNNLNGAVTMRVQFSQPAKEKTWNEEQAMRRLLFTRRTELFLAEAAAEVAWNESATESSITLKTLQYESCNCR
jgi:LytS/YehU family sensor histidine kinase